MVQHHLAAEKNKLAEVELPMSVSPGKKVEVLLHSRLRANARIHPYLADAVELLAAPRNIRQSLDALGELSDEIWFLAGDRSTDSTWYARRGSLAAVYALCENFQKNDFSKDYQDTMKLASTQVEKWDNIERAGKGLLDWAEFSARSMFNIARSLSR